MLLASFFFLLYIIWLHDHNPVLNSDESRDLFLTILAGTHADEFCRMGLILKYQNLILLCYTDSLVVCLRIWYHDGRLEMKLQNAYILLLQLLHMRFLIDSPMKEKILGLSHEYDEKEFH